MSIFNIDQKRFFASSSAVESFVYECGTNHLFYCKFILAGITFCSVKNLHSLYYGHGVNLTAVKRDKKYGKT